jgi:hypothetical protein
VVWACGETGLVKKFIVHRFDSLAKVVVSAVFQGSVDIFQKRFLMVTGGMLIPDLDRSGIVRPMTRDM